MAVLQTFKSSESIPLCLASICKALASAFLLLQSASLLRGFGGICTRKQDMLTMLLRQYTVPAANQDLQAMLPTSAMRLSAAGWLDFGDCLNNRGLQHFPGC